MIDQTRRTFLGQTGLSLGSAALASLLSDQANAAPLNSLPHFAAKAKRVIFLCMSGGPSHLETFDYKPQLDKLNGKDLSLIHI